MLKEKIIELAHQGKITFDDEIMTSNLNMVTLKTISAFPTIQFGSFETIKRKALSSSMVTPKISYDDTHRDIHLHEDESSVTDREEWTLMARQRNRKAKSSVLLNEILKSCVVRKPPRMEKSKRTKVAPLPLKEKFMQNSR